MRDIFGEKVAIKSPVAHQRYEVTKSDTFNDLGSYCIKSLFSSDLTRLDGCDHLDLLTKKSSKIKKFRSVRKIVDLNGYIQLQDP